MGSGPRRSLCSGMRALFVGLEGQQRNVACALDGLGEFALVLGGDARDARRQNLPSGGEETLQQLDIFVVDDGARVGHEGADLLSGATEAPAEQPCAWRRLVAISSTVPSISPLSSITFSVHEISSGYCGRALPRRRICIVRIAPEPERTPVSRGRETAIIHADFASRSRQPRVGTSASQVPHTQYIPLGLVCRTILTMDIGESLSLLLHDGQSLTNPPFFFVAIFAGLRAAISLSSFQNARFGVPVLCPRIPGDGTAGVTTGVGVCQCPFSHSGVSPHIRREPERADSHISFVVSGVVHFGSPVQARTKSPSVRFPPEAATPASAFFAGSGRKDLLGPCGLAAGRERLPLYSLVDLESS